MKRAITASLLVLVVAGFALWQADLLKWPFAAQNALPVSGLGFWMNVLGLCLTLGGFGITFEQLRRTKSVAEAAKAEAERIKISLNAFDLAHGASRAQYALSVTRRYIRNSMWSDAADSFEDFRRGLNALKANGAPLTPEQEKHIEDASHYIQNLCLRIERGLQKGNLAIDVAKTMNVIRGHDDLISDISVAIQKDVVK